jgi:uncharacterized protein (TIGR02266 family)
MSQDSPKDLRRHPRIDVALQVKLRFATIDRFRLFTTKNFSEGGMFVVTDNPKPPGARVQVVLYPPGLELGLPIHGTVVHALTSEEAKARGTRPGMGIRFDDLDDEARESVQALVDAVVREAAPEPSARPAPPSPPPPAAEERRVTERVTARAAVRLRFENAQLFREFYTKDLSRGGVFVCTPNLLPEGTEVELLLTPPGGKPEIRLDGRVAHVVPPGPNTPESSTGMGIEFVGLTLEKRVDIAQCIEELAQRPETLGRVRPMAVAQVRYEDPGDFERIVRMDLRHRRLVVESKEQRPVGTTMRVLLHAPQLPHPIELHGQVESVVTPEEAALRGLRAGLHLRLTDLDDEYLADIELRLGPRASQEKAAPARPAPVPRPPGARPPRPTTPAEKAAMLAEAAAEDLKAGRRNSAIANLKLALTFDPANAECRRRLDDLVAGK